MLKIILLLFSLLFFFGCSQNIGGFGIGNSDTSLDSRLQKQKDASDAEVAKLEDEIAKYEADKVKYSKDYQTFDNNPILDELDETLKAEDNATKPDTLTNKELK